jgi:hypothetical protein
VTGGNDIFLKENLGGGNMRGNSLLLQPLFSITPNSNRSFHPNLISS